MESPHFMDYTMENNTHAMGMLAQQQATQNFHCQPAAQSGPPPHPNGHASSQASSSRENQRYDPVYEATGWYPANTNTNAPVHPSYSASQGSQWMVNPHPPVNNWQGFGDAQAQYESSIQAHAADSAVAYRDSRPPQPPPFSALAYTGMPWSEGRAPVGALVNYGTYPDQRHDEPVTHERTNVPPNPSNIHAQQQQRAYRESQIEHRRVLLRDHRPPPPQSTASGAPAPNFRGLGGRQQRSTNRRPRGDADNEWASSYTASYGHLPRRYVEDSEDEDDSVESSMVEEYRRSAEQLFHADDRERRMAAIRGAMPVIKRPSKAALASLIIMTAKEVEEEGREGNCMICYNNYGQANPEGIVEHPLQLPKCKHIFGNVCLKKWFEDADTCPYCRDKLPSEKKSRKAAALEAYRQSRDRERALLAAAQEQRALTGQLTAATQTGNERSATGSRIIPAFGGAAYDQLTDDDRLRAQLQAETLAFAGRQHERMVMANSSPERHLARGRVGSNIRASQQISRSPALLPMAGVSSDPDHYLSYMRSLTRPGTTASPGNAFGSFYGVLPPLPPGLNFSPQHNTSGAPSTTAGGEEASPAVAVGSLSGTSAHRGGNSSANPSTGPSHRPRWSLDIGSRADTVTMPAMPTSSLHAQLQAQAQVREFDAVPQSFSLEDSTIRSWARHNNDEDSPEPFSAANSNWGLRN